MSKLTSTQAADKLIRNLGAATESIRQGVDSVKESPMEKAAQNPEAFLAGVNRSVTNGKWQAGLRRVSLDQWKQLFKEKGIPRIASGAQAARSKIISFYDEFLPYLDRGVEQVKAMPNATLEDNIARSTAMIRYNAQFKRSN